MDKPFIFTIVISLLAGSFLGIQVYRVNEEISYKEILTQIPTLPEYEEYMECDFPVPEVEYYPVEVEAECPEVEEVVCEDVTAYQDEIDYWKNAFEEQKIWIRNLEYTISQANL